MKITGVATAVVQANYDYTFVRVYTDEGVHGTGECFMAPGLTGIIRDLGDLLVGLDPADPVLLRARLMAAASGSGGMAGAGIAYNAISGLDAALWDLRGKMLGEPVARLLGGMYRDHVEVYVDLHAGDELASMDNVLRYRRPFWLSEDGRTHLADSIWEAAEPDADSSEAMLARAREALAARFQRVKFDLDVFSTRREVVDRSISRADLAKIRERAAWLRESLGDEVDIAFDCHWRFDVPTAVQVAEALAASGPMWLEDPVPPDPKALAAVAASSPVPVATGENTFLLEGFATLVDHGSAHILTPDVQKAGGLLESVRIADFAARHFLPIAPHCIASPLGFMAAAHVCAASSNVTCLEFHGMDVPFWSNLVRSDTPIISGGRVHVSDAPGVGVELDLEVVRAYAAPGEPVFDEPPVR